MNRHLIPFVLALLLGSPPAAHAEGLIGYDRLDIRSSHRALPIAASIWYPAGDRTYLVQIGDNPLFKGAGAYLGAAIDDGPHPLILLSHGSGGNMDGLAWLGSALAMRGAMVLAVNHPGSSSGDSSPRRSMQLGARAADLSAALDQVLADPDFAPHIDSSRIAALGFSLGGTTALNLAGLRFDAAQMPATCNLPDRIGAGCDFYRKGGVDLGRLPADFEADASDARVSRAVAIDPGFTTALAEDSIGRTEIPILLINLGDASTLWTVADVGARGSDLAARLPNGTRIAETPAHHFTFLPECKPAAAEMLKAEGEDPICDDPEGTDRNAVHARIVEDVAMFLGL